MEGAFLFGKQGKRLTLLLSKSIVITAWHAKNHYIQGFFEVMRCLILLSAFNYVLKNLIMKNIITLLLCMLSAIMVFADPTNVFLENNGQVRNQYNSARPDIDFMYRAANGPDIFIGDGAIHYQWSKAIAEQRQDNSKEKPGTKNKRTDYKMYRMDVRLLNANTNAEVIKADKSEYYEMYYKEYTGNDGIRAEAFEKITYVDVYPNIDWVFYAANGELKHEFIIKAGGNANDIKIQYSGATALMLNADGSLTATTPMGTITENAPYCYTAEGMEVASSFLLNNNILSYKIGNYSGDLIIDPKIEWGTYYGGSGNEVFYANGADAAGAIYSGGYTTSSGIATSGAFDETYSANDDGIIVKLSSNGSRQWATYIGGNQEDVIRDLAATSSGDVYVCGYTYSTGGIADLNSKVRTIDNDGFLLRFNTNGTRNWGTYVGHLESDRLDGIAVSASNVFVCGTTNSTLGIAMAGSHQGTKTVGTNNDGFIAGYNLSGTKTMGTYYGGESTSEELLGIEVAGNELIVVGATFSATGIASSGAYQSTNAGNGDAVIASFSHSGARNWGTYYGGSGSDGLERVKVDKNGNIFAVGVTQSSSGIAFGSGIHQSSFNASGFNDGVIIKLNSNGSPQWCTYYGGSANDLFFDIAINNTGDVLATGRSQSTTDIATSNGYMSTPGGSTDGIITSFSQDGTRNWGSYYGGSSADYLYGICIDNMDNICVVGHTSGSTSGIATPSGHDNSYNGGNDGIIVKFCDNPVIGTQPADQTKVEGTQAIFTIDVTSGASVYQWQTDMGSGFQDVANTGQYSGATTNTLTVSNITLSNKNQKFRCKVGYSQCQVNSNEVTLSVFPTGISSLSTQKAISIYPNPNNGIFSVNIPGDKTEIVITNITGQVIKRVPAEQGGTLTIDISGEPGGIYLLHLTNRETTMTEKLVVH